jgi:hypothetical protein
MSVDLHPHALSRLPERGATHEEVVQAVEGGEPSPAKFGRTCFRRDFAGGHLWRGKRFDTKRIEAYAVHENGRWLVITVIVKFF